MRDSSRAISCRLYQIPGDIHTGDFHPTFRRHQRELA
jgi:hypothetical protein